MDAAAWEKAGLYDPDAPGASTRRALRAHLSGAGVTLEELRAAASAGELVTAFADKMLRGPRTLSARALAAETGIPLERVLRIWLAMGLPVDDPDAKVLPPDAEALTSLFFEGAKTFGEEGILGFCRVMAAAASQVAEAAVALFLGEVQPKLEQDHASEVEWAEANEAAISSLDAVGAAMARLVHEHAIVAIRRSRSARGQDRSAPRELEMAVCFVDLVGSTGWGQRLSLSAQAVALGRFESAAWEESVRRGGRVVKLIGDEVMITSASATEACAIAVAVCDRVSGDDGLPQARGAVGFGTVLFRDGDYFGPLVNVVARAVKAAEPGQVVVTAAVRALLQGDRRFRVGELADHQLRGIDDVVALAPLLR
jgi:class 3 adenylate cyclase